MSSIIFLAIIFVAFMGGYALGHVCRAGGYYEQGYQRGYVEGHSQADLEKEL